MSSISWPANVKHHPAQDRTHVYTASTTFAILESIRLDLGFGSQVHP